MSTAITAAAGEKEKPETRDFGVVGRFRGISGVFPPNFSPNEGDKGGMNDAPDVLAAYAKAQEKRAQQAAQRAAQRQVIDKLGACILTSKRGTDAVLGACDSASIEPKTLIPALQAIIHGLMPGDAVTTEQLTSLANTDALSKRWLRDDLPTLLDTLGITQPATGKARRWATLQELKRAASPSRQILQKAVTVGATVGVSIADKTAATICSNPYVTVTPDGQVLRHDRPQNTEAGKEARRALKEAEYLAKTQHKAMRLRKEAELSALNKDPYASNGAGKSWLWVAGSFAALLAILAVLAASNAPAPVDIQTQNAIIDHMTRGQ